MLKLWCLNPNPSSQGQQLWVKYAHLFQWWTVRASMAFSAVLHILRKICIYMLLFFFKDVNAIIRHSLSSSCHIHQAMLLTMLYIMVELLSNQISADRKDASHGCANIFNYFDLACFQKSEIICLLLLPKNRLFRYLIVSCDWSRFDLVGLIWCFLFMSISMLRNSYQSVFIQNQIITKYFLVDLLYHKHCLVLLMWNAPVLVD